MTDWKTTSNRICPYCGKTILKETFAHRLHEFPDKRTTALVSVRALECRGCGAIYDAAPEEDGTLYRLDNYEENEEG